MAIAIVGLAFVLAAVAAAAILGVTERGETSPRQAVRAGDSSPCRRPYTDWSPWNTPIVSGVHDARSGGSRAFPPTADVGSRPSTPTPCTRSRVRTPRQPVQLDGVYSDVRGGGRILTFQRRGSIALPLPGDATPAWGTDGQIIVHDPETGDEWGGWRFSRSFDGSWRAVNAYHYNTRWSGVPPRRAARAVRLARCRGPVPRRARAPVRGQARRDQARARVRLPVSVA